jgi:hypothetical protein
VLPWLTGREPAFRVGEVQILHVETVFGKCGREVVACIYFKFIIAINDARANSMLWSEPCMHAII